MVDKLPDEVVPAGEVGIELAGLELVLCTLELLGVELVGVD